MLVEKMIGTGDLLVRAPSCHHTPNLVRAVDLNCRIDECRRCAGQLLSLISDNPCSGFIGKLPIQSLVQAINQCQARPNRIFRNIES